MNQILVTSLKKGNKRKFIFIFLISLIFICWSLVYVILNLNKTKQEEELNSIYSQILSTQKLYNVQNMQIENSVIFGTIKIPKINLVYVVFRNLNEELLKISVCKFSGEELEENGNIAIAGHNYNDERFFGKVKELEIGDEIRIEDLKGKEFIYKVSEVYETSPEDISCLEYNEKNIKELTLVTCNNSNGKRIIVKAAIKQ